MFLAEKRPVLCHSGIQAFRHSGRPTITTTTTKTQFQGVRTPFSVYRPLYRPSLEGINGKDGIPVIGTH